MKQWKKILCAILVCCMIGSMLPVSANAATEYTVNGVSIPVWGKDHNGNYRQFYDMSASYGKSQCWAFAQMVYQQLWNNQKFTSYRNTSDDMLRNVGSGNARAITAGNTKTFVGAAKLGSVIRIASDIEGADGVPAGTNKHSFILVQKDNEGFTVYHSGSVYVRLQYFTWAAFANQFAKSYKYFKYIKWPGANAFNTVSKPSNATLSVDRTSAAIGETITFTASSSGASYYSLTVKTPSGQSYPIGNFSSSITYSPTEVGDYKFSLYATNSVGTTTGSSVIVSAYSAVPDIPQITLSTSTAIVGQTVTISYGGSTYADTYSYLIERNGSSYKSGTSAAGDSLNLTFPEGAYQVKVTASNAFGDSSTTVDFSVKGHTASGSCGDDATWAFDSRSGLLAIGGTGAMYNYDATGTAPPEYTYITNTPWQIFANSIKRIEVGEGITTIGDWSFAELPNLEWVTLPEESLTDINFCAFYRCKMLKGTSNMTDLNWFVIPASVKSLGAMAFANDQAFACVYFTGGSDNLPVMTSNTFGNCADDLSLVGFAGEPKPYGYDNWCIELRDVKVFLDPCGGKLDLEPANNALGSSKWYQEYGWVFYGGSYGQYKTNGGLPTPTREGYTFLGWYSKPTGGVQITPATECWNPFWHTIYAHWKKNEYDVTLIDSNAGGAKVASIRVGYMDTYDDLPMLDAEDADFMGWSTSPDGGQIVTNNSVFTFTNDQTLYAQWNSNLEGGSNSGEEQHFSDVSSSDYFYDAVVWALDNSITAGTSSTTFSPNQACTRAQAVTFLWRAAGSPDVSGNNPFSDVSSSDYYYKAVLWAVQNGVTSGTSAKTFSPVSVCQRSQIVSFLYRYAGSPSVSGSKAFNDVSSGSYYYSAVQWAVNNNVTSGTGNGQFSPESTCTRAQIVTFLYRYIAE